jgi:polyhydroxyalkanoate synthesis regulator phasin
MSAELIALICTVGAAAIVFAWNKWGKALLAKAPKQVKDLIEDGVEELADGELTEEEVKKRLEEILPKDKEETEE